MNKLRIILFVFATVVGSMLTSVAENIITLSSLSGKPEDEVFISIDLSNTDDITALQLDMPIDASLTLVEGSAVLEASRSDGHSVSISKTQDGIRVVVYGNSLKPIKGNSGRLCSFLVKLGYKPIRYVLHPVATLVGTGGRPVSAKVVDGSITTLLPDIKVVTESIDFGRQIIRGSYSKNLIIRNTGTDVLHVTSMSTDDGLSDEISVDYSPFNVQPDQEASIPILFAPHQRGIYSQQVKILSDAIDKSEVSAVVHAESYSVNELHLGTAEGHSQDILTIGVRMNNMEDVSAVQFTLSLPGELQFVAGSATSCYEGFSASSSLKDGQLNLMLYSLSGALISEGDRDVMSFQIKLVGAGGNYSLIPQNVVIGSKTLENIYSGAESGSVQVQSPIISVLTTLRFESVEVEQPYLWSYEISNVGEDPLEINKILFQSEEYKVLTSLPLTIQKGKTETLSLEYRPSQTGLQETNMDVYSNDPVSPIVTTSITAEVFAPNALKVTGNVDLSKSMINVDFSLDNYTPISAMQADIRLSESMNAVGDIEIVSELLKDYTVSCKQISEGMYRFIAYTVQGAPITPSRVHGQDENAARRLITLHIPIKDNATLGGILVSLNDIKLSDENGVDVSSNQTAQYEYTPVELVYDINGDGMVDITDVILIVKMVREGAYHSQFDYDYDGSLTILDAHKVLLYYLNK